MKAFALGVIAAIGLATAPSARADFWFDGPSFGSGALYDRQYHGGPYFVAGFGDDNYRGQRRYWGGPYWVDCSGYNPPFETYRMSCRPTVVRIATRDHRGRIKVRLK
jgi:hypothetical protein